MKKILGRLFAILSLVAISHQCISATLDADSALWNEVKSTNLMEDYQTYLDQYPSGKFVALAKNRIKKLQTESPSATKGSKPDRLPVTDSSIQPQVPFDLNENIWNTLKISEFYKNLPRSRTIKSSHQATVDTQYTGSKSSSLPKTSWSENVTNEVTPLGGKCSAERNSRRANVTTAGYPPAQSNAETVTYRCGPVVLGITLNGKPSQVTKRVDVEGSLFPLKVGAEQNTIYTNYLIANPTFENTHATRCRVLSKGHAKDIDHRLTGASWALRCETTWQMNGIVQNANSATSFEDYFLEDSGVFLHEIGKGGNSQEKVSLPSTGSQTVSISSGDYGSRTTTTYQSYEWMVSK